MPEAVSSLKASLSQVWFPGVKQPTQVATRRVQSQSRRPTVRLSSVHPELRGAAPSWRREWGLRGGKKASWDQDNILVAIEKNDGQEPQGGSPAKDIEQSDLGDGEAVM